ncbi:hypothetical protein FCV82_12100, partial [Vibrio breoganii]
MTFNRFLPLISIGTIVLTQLSTLLLMVGFGKQAAGELGKIVVWSLFASQLCILGGEQASIKSLLNRSKETESINLTFLSFTLISLTALFFIVYANDIFKDFTLGQSIFLTSVLMLVLLKWSENYLKVVSKYQVSQVVLFLLSTLLLLLYGLAYYTKYSSIYDFFLLHRMVGLTIAIVIFIYAIKLNSIKFRLKINIKVFAKNWAFILALFFGLLNAFIDKLLLTKILNANSYADFMLLSSIIALAVQPKMVVSNQYLSKIKVDTWEYFNKVRAEATILTIVVVLIGYVAYLTLTTYVLDDYHLYSLAYIFLAIFCVLDCAFGPTTTIINYIYNPKFTLYADIFGFALFLIAITPYYFFGLEINAIVYFSFAVVISKT